MSALWQLIFTLFGQEAKRRVLGEGQRLLLLTYLRTLRAARRITLFGFFVLFALQLLVLAGMGTLVCGVLLFESDPHRQLQILFGACATLFVLPLIALVSLLSEKTWFKASGAAGALADLDQK